MGKYTDWMIRLYRSGNLKMEDLYKATEYLEAFHKFKNRIEKKDIGQYQSLPELYRVVRTFIDNPDQATSKSDEIRKIKEGAEKVYEDDEWLVIVPHTKEAAIEYGKGTQWCTAAKESYNYFDYYNNDGPLYININKKTGRKYQFHFETGQFMDENDSPTTNEYIGLSDDLIAFYAKKYEGQTIELLADDVEKYIKICKDNGIDYLRSFIESGCFSKYFSEKFKGHLDIPNSVKNIGRTAFEGCHGLTSVTIPDSVENIFTRAFINCENLTSVTIPDSVKSIGAEAFSYCKNLEFVDIPNSVTSIGTNAFAACKNLKSVTIPDKVNVINDCVFSWCTGLASVTIPDSVECIGDYAFIGCKGLTSVTIGNSVIMIGNHAFKDCTSLTSITIPDSVVAIGYSSFKGCRGLKSVTLSRSLGYIHEGTFQDCTNLTSITIPDSVKKILNGAFAGCTGLTSIVIPDSVNYIGINAFEGCNNLMIYAKGEKIYRRLVKYNGFKNVKKIEDESIQNESKRRGILMNALDEILRNYG